MKVYLAGPMTGIPEFNADGFAAAERYAAGRGWEPVSPQWTDPSHDGPCPPGECHATPVGSHPYPCWVRASLRALLTSEAVLMLPGWEASRGARLERDVAEICALPVLEMPSEQGPSLNKTHPGGTDG